MWAAPQSQIYPTLRRMQRDELIVGDDEARGPRLTRTVYSLTDNGRAELRSWLATPHELAPARDPFLLQAVNFEMIEPAQARAVLDEFIEEQQRIVLEAEAHRDRLPHKDTALLRERLANRDPADHDRIARLKAHVFDGMADVARTRMAWARKGKELLGG